MKTYVLFSFERHNYYWLKVKKIMLKNWTQNKIMLQSLVLSALSSY